MSNKLPTIGELRHRVTFETDSGTADSDRWVAPSWGDVASVPNVQAKIEPANVRENFEAGQSRPEAFYHIWVRDRTDVTSADRITATLHSASRTFQIRGFRRLPMEKPQWLRFTCEEMPAQ